MKYFVYIIICFSFLIFQNNLYAQSEQKQTIKTYYYDTTGTLFYEEKVCCYVDGVFSCGPTEEIYPDGKKESNSLDFFISLIISLALSVLIISNLIKDQPPSSGFPGS